MITTELIQQLMKLNTKSNKKLVLNNTYKCEFIIPSNLNNDETFYFFSEAIKDKTCPRISNEADVKLYQKNIDDYVLGKLYISFDSDLGKDGLYTLMYIIIENNKITSMTSVSSCLIEDI